MIELPRNVRDQKSPPLAVAIEGAGAAPLSAVAETSPARRVKTRLLALGSLTAIYLVLTAWNLNLQHIVSPDEPRYACAARHMLESGDYIVPLFNARPRVEKPVFFHWLLCAAGSLSLSLGLSLTTIGFRLVPLCAGLATVLALYLLGERILNPRGAFIGALILITTWHFHDTSRELVVDMTLCACLLWSWLFFHISCARIESGRPRFWSLLGFYLSLGCACMTKGPCLVALFSTVPVVAYLAWTKRLSILKSAGVWWGAPLSLALGLTYWVMIKNRGLDASEFFAIENFARFLGMKDHIHYIPYFYYLYSLWQIFQPWIFVLPFVAWWTYKFWRQRRAELTDGAKLLACGLGLGFGFVGLSVSKRHLYLIPIFPFMALWVGWYFERFFLSRSQLPGRTAVAWFFRVAGAGVLAWLIWWATSAAHQGITVGESMVCIVLGALFCGACLAAAKAWSESNTQRTLSCLLGMAMLFTFGLEAVKRPFHERELNLEPFYAEVDKNLGDRRLVMYGTNSNEASWYLSHVPGPIDDILQDEIRAKFFESPNTALLVTKSFLNRNKLLKNCVKPVSPELYRFRTPFYLVVPDPANMPDEELYKTRVPTNPASLFDFL